MESKASVPVARGEAVSFVTACSTFRKRLSPNVHDKWLPPKLRLSHRELHPWISEPNRTMEGTVGYSLAVRTFCTQGVHVTDQAPQTCSTVLLIKCAM